MTTFRYAALDTDRQKVRGTVEATSLTNARFELLTRELDILKLSERKSLGSFELTPKKLKPEDVMFLSRQLAAFIRSGIPIITAVEAIAEENDNVPVRKLLLDAADRLRGGATLSDALEAHNANFPIYYVPMVRSAELTGDLDTVLQRLSTYIERDVEARRAIRSALVYPSMILGMSVVTVFILVAYVLPKFAKFFKSFDTELPLPTRILLGFAGFVSQWFVVIGAVIILTVVLVIAALRTETGKYVRDRMLLRIPMIKVIVRYAVTERFCRILGSLLEAGVPLPTSLFAAAEGANNRVYRRALEIARVEMMEGKGIAQPLANLGLFPALANQMIRVGEQTGTIALQLETAAEFYEVEVSHRLKKLTTLFEPLVIIFIGLVVGFVAVAMVSAMYGIFQGKALK